MAKAIVAVVTGIPETVASFDKLAAMDYSKAEGEAGRSVLSTVKALTRSDTGHLQSAWNVEGGAFVNEEDYATYQEFGTRYVPPAFAVFRAWDAKQAQVEKAFEKEIENVARQAGFDT
jgi:Bacteriophage HK97-gp10, putative tail-component